MPNSPANENHEAHRAGGIATFVVYPIKLDIIHSREEQFLAIEIERHIWHGYWHAETVKKNLSPAHCTGSLATTMIWVPPPKYACMDLDRVQSKQVTNCSPHPINLLGSRFGETSIPPTGPHKSKVTIRLNAFRQQAPSAHRQTQSHIQSFLSSPVPFGNKHCLGACTNTITACCSCHRQCLSARSTAFL